MLKIAQWMQTLSAHIRTSYMTLGAPAIGTKLQCEYGLCMAFNSAGTARHGTDTKHSLRLINDLYNGLRRRPRLRF